MRWKQRLKIALATGLVVGLIAGIVDCIARIAVLNFEWFEFYQALLLPMILFAAGFTLIGLVIEAWLLISRRQLGARQVLSFHVAIGLFLLLLFYGEVIVYHYLLPPHHFEGKTATNMGRAAVLFLSLLLLSFLLLQRRGILSHIVSFFDNQKTRAVLKDVIFAATIFIITSLVIDIYLQNTYTIPVIGGEIKESPNVILITLDTVGADHLTTYNYQRNTTPNLDRFAKDSVVFDNAISPSSWTLPSHASYFTGKYSENHGLVFGYQNFDSTETTLAEILQAEGYTTGGFIAAAILKGQYGMSRGFHTYKDRMDFFEYTLKYRKFNIAEALDRAFPGFYKLLSSDEELRSEEVNKQVFEWLEMVKDRPFFLFINYFDAHYPYNLGEEFRSRFTNDSIPVNEIEKAMSRQRYEETDEALIEYVIALYDSELLYLDRNLGELFDKLDEMNLMDNTIIIIEADHGEEFYEHGGFGHMLTLYEEVIHVPLIIHYPRLFESARIEKRIEVFNIFPTILDLLEIELPDDIDAVSLVPLLKGKPGFEKESSSTLLGYEVGNIKYTMQSITHHNWKLIEVSPEMEGVPPSLFNLEDDPGEQKNLYLENEEIRDELRAVIVNLTWYHLWSQSESDVSLLRDSR